MVAPKAERYTQLDGLRGLAAFSVFLLHVAEITKGRLGDHGFTPWLLLEPIWDGQAAVVLFFALSGFVLALPYTGSVQRAIDTVPFLVRRLFRLYPAYWLAIGLALALRFTVFQPAGLAGLSVWINTIWDQPFGLRDLLGHMALIAPHVDIYHLDPVLWSLSAEVKVSLIYPAILLLLRRCPNPAWIVPIMAASMFCDLRLHLFGHITLFLFGGFLARYREPVVRVLTGSRGLRLALVPCAWFLYGIGLFHLPLRGDVLDQFAAAGAVIWIALFLTSGTLRAVGNSRTVNFLGQVSYSFYLIHLPILMVLTSQLFPRTGSMVPVALAALALSLGVSWVIYKLVEVPTQNWGRALGKAWSARKE